MTLDKEPEKMFFTFSKCVLGPKLTLWTSPKKKGLFLAVFAPTKNRGFGETNKVFQGAKKVNSELLLLLFCYFILVPYLVVQLWNKTWTTFTNLYSFRNNVLGLLVEVRNRTEKKSEKMEEKKVGSNWFLWKRWKNPSFFEALCLRLTS